MFSEITKVLILNSITDKTKFELINKFSYDKPKKLSYYIQLLGIKDKFKIRMLNLLMKKLIKSDDNEALTICFLILSHDSYSAKMKRITHKFLKIYNSCELNKQEKNEQMLFSLLKGFEG